jgi:hypothetical protein
LGTNSKARDTRAKWNGAVDRYSHDRRSRVSLHDVGSGVDPNRQARVKHAIVDDPMEKDGAKKLRVAINYRTDALENERANRRISPAAYMTGRIMQHIFETSTRVSGSNWRGGDRVDAAVAHEDAIIRALGNADKRDELMAQLEDDLGKKGVDFLRKILTGERTFQSYAAHEHDLAARRLGLRRGAPGAGKPGDRAIGRVADRFRWALEEAAEILAATGKSRAPIRGVRAEHITAEEFDEKGRLVPAGQGYRWGERHDAHAGEAATAN